MAPKSATAPVSIAIAERIGGLPELTAGEAALLAHVFDGERAGSEIGGLIAGRELISAGHRRLALVAPGVDRPGVIHQRGCGFGCGGSDA